MRFVPKRAPMHLVRLAFQAWIGKLQLRLRQAALQPGEAARQRSTRPGQFALLVDIDRNWFVWAPGRMRGSSQPIEGRHIVLSILLLLLIVGFYLLFGALLSFSESVIRRPDAPGAEAEAQHPRILPWREHGSWLSICFCSCWPAWSHTCSTRSSIPRSSDARLRRRGGMCRSPPIRLHARRSSWLNIGFPSFWRCWRRCCW